MHAAMFASKGSIEVARVIPQVKEAFIFKILFERTFPEAFIFKIFFGHIFPLQNPNISTKKPTSTKS